MEYCEQLIEMINIEDDIFQSDVFTFDQSYNLDLDMVYQVIKGESCGAILRNIFPLDACARVTENFWKNSNLCKLKSNGSAYYVGTYHHEKKLDDYLEEAEKNSLYLNDFFDGTINIFEKIIIAIGNRLAENGINFRAAAHNKLASEFLIRSWVGEGDHSLSLSHKSSAQGKALNQASFEIKKASRNPLVAVNICLDVPVSAGNLHYWNIIPSDKCKNSLGLTYFEKRNIPIRVGDICFFNEKSVHVVSSLEKPDSKQTTISFLMAKLDDETVIYWA